LADSGSTRKTLFLLLLIAAIAGIAWRFWVIAEEDRAKALDKPKPPVPVTLAQAVARDVPVLLEVVGRAEAYESVTLMSRLDGQVAAVDYDEGRHVARGDVLVRLDPSDFEARLRQAEANLARDQAQLAKARADLARHQALKAQGFISEEKVEETRATLAAAEATVKADQAAVELARLHLSWTVVRAPIAGVVGARLVFPGTAVKVNDTPLAVVNRVRPLFVSFAVPERHLARLRERLLAGGLEVAVRVPGDDAPPQTGAVRFLDNAVDAATGTIRMKATLANADERLTPGQHLAVSLRLDTLREAVTVPAEAVQQGPDGTFVYVVKADRTAELRPVTLDVVHAGTAALAEGLRAGETVITDGHSRLTPGAKVKAKEGG
jgi:multidrug efflux system membrane fusion protein